MEEVKAFLETSTIHGINHVITSRKCSKYFWIFVVFSGFLVAGFLISESFQNWRKSPISTTVETLPISQITFPNVTVCPPTHSFLNLNYDIMNSEKQLENKTRKDLLAYTADVLQDEFYEEVMTNLSEVQDPERFYNWYNGYTDIEYQTLDTYNNKYEHIVRTSATSGNITTQYFGDEFDIDKLQSNYEIEVYIYVPEKAQNDKNTTFMLKIEQESMEEKDELRFGTGFGGEKIDSKVFSKNFSAPKSYYALKYKRFEIGNMNGKEMQKMPGFRISWKYDTDVVSEAQYKNNEKTLEFVR